MTDRTPTVVVTSDDTLPEIINRLSGAARGGRVVDLVVPIDSSLLLTAAEFRALKDALDTERLPVTLRTADPLRLQLAERLGLPVQSLPRVKVAAVAAPRPAVVAAPQPAPAAAPVAPPAENGNAPEVRAVPSVMAPGRDPESLWPALDAEEETSEGGEQLEEAAAAGPGNPPRRWLPVAVLLLLLVLGTAGAVRLLLPRAVVTIVPRVQPVSAALVFDVTADGQPLDDGAAFALPMERRQIEVEWSGEVPVSEVRVVPDGTAAGAIELRNTAAEPVTIAAGTVVTTETGTAFAFAEEVIVPAADAASGEPGAAAGSVRAVQPGTGGNVATGEIGGRLPNGVYYSNRMEPTVGGTDKEFPVVAETDLELLAAQAREAAPTLAAAMLAKEDGGQAVVPSSVVVVQQRDAFSNEVGAEVSAVRATSTLMLEVVAYDGDRAASTYEQDVLAQLQSAAPAGFAIDPESIVLDEPVEKRAGDDGIRLEVAARTEAVAVLDEAERQAMATALVGASPDEAAAILSGAPDIAEFRIDYRPAWLVKQMPGNANQITFETVR